MVEVRTTPEYDEWFASLKDTRAQQRVNIRIRRVSLGNFGDAKSVGKGVGELRIDYGPGYRVYFKQVGAVILLTGGTKKTQSRDIRFAQALAQELE